MATLRDEHKTLIVQRLATFVSPTEIKEELSQQGVDVSLRQIAYYDPTLKSAGASDAWRQLHAEIRAQFVKDTASIAIANKAYRLRELDDMQRRAKLRKNFPLAAQLLEQAAKEMGEAYTNRRVIETGDPLESLAKMLGIPASEIAGALAGPPASGT